MTIIYVADIVILRSQITVQATATNPGPTTSKKISPAHTLSFFPQPIQVQRITLFQLTLQSQCSSIIDQKENIYQ